MTGSLPSVIVIVNASFVVIGASESTRAVVICALASLTTSKARLPVMLFFRLVLKTLLVTGDSLAQPLDVQLARRLAGDGVRTVRDAHLGTGSTYARSIHPGMAPLVMRIARSTMRRR